MDFKAARYWAATGIESYGAGLAIGCRTMKSDLFLAVVLSLLAGCRAPTGEVNRTARQAELSSAQPSPAVQPRPAPRQTPRRVVYFSGAFTKNGCYAWTNGMTLKDGLDMAGGFSNWATGRLRLIRRDGSQEIYRIGTGGTLTNNPVLQPEDLVISREHLPALF